MCGAVFAVEAVNALSRVTLVRVFAKVVTLGDLEGLERDDLVECVCRARELLAGVAMAEDVSLLVLLQGGSPLCLLAVAVSLEVRHCDWFRLRRISVLS